MNENTIPLQETSAQNQSVEIGQLAMSDAVGDETPALHGQTEQDAELQEKINLAHAAALSGNNSRMQAVDERRKQKEQGRRYDPGFGHHMMKKDDKYYDRWADEHERMWLKETREEIAKRQDARQPDTYERDAERAEHMAYAERATRQMIENIQANTLVDEITKQQIIEDLHENATKLVGKAGEEHDAIKSNVRERLGGEDNLLGKVLYAVENGRSYEPISVLIGSAADAQKFPYGPEAYEQATFEVRDTLLATLGINKTDYRRKSITEDGHPSVREKTEIGSYSPGESAVANIRQALVTDMDTGLLVNLAFKIERLPKS